MGLAAAATVVIAVLVAITLLPAMMGFAGERLVPKPGSRAAKREAADAAETTGAGGSSWGPGGRAWSPAGRCSPC